MLRDHAEAHLMTIESAYGIRILNRGEIAEWIASAIPDRKDILLATTYLNTWVALNNISGDVEISCETVERIIRRILQGYVE